MRAVETSYLLMAGEVACCEHPYGALMAFARRLLPVVVLPALLAVPASAKVLDEGKPTAAGLYWQKVDKNNGTVSYLCPSKTIPKILRGNACENAEAKKLYRSPSD